MPVVSSVLCSGMNGFIQKWHDGLDTIPKKRTNPINFVGHDTVSGSIFITISHVFDAWIASYLWNIDSIGDIKCIERCQLGIKLLNRWLAQFDILSILQEIDLNFDAFCQFCWCLFGQDRRLYWNFSTFMPSSLNPFQRFSGLRGTFNMVCMTVILLVKLAVEMKHAKLLAKYRLDKMWFW